MSEATKSKEANDVINTKLLMVTSAVFMALIGIGASFLSEEILAYYGARSEGLGVVLIQTTGALYLGFAVLNWMARGNPIGGIYSRPVALGNFFHFFVVATVLLKRVISGQTAIEFVVGAVACSIFAGGFGYLVFGRGTSCG